MTSKASKGSSTVRFYFLLSWLFTAYYVVAISRGSSLSDLEISCTQTSPYLPVLRPPSQSDISKLLFKHLNNLNACNVVKLRGVTSNTNDSRKKAQKSPWSTNSYCVVMIILSVVCLVQVLRSLARLIHDKLFRAGDVETNPGPTPPSSPTPPTPDPPASPLDHTAEVASPSGASSQPVLSIETIDSGMPPSISAATPNGAGDIRDDLPLPHGHTEALTATNPSDMSADTRRKVLVPNMPVPHTHTHNPQYFPTQKDSSPIGDSSKYQPPKTAHKSPHQESVSHASNSLGVGIGLTKAKEKPHLVHHHDFGELRRSGSSVDLNQYKISHSNKISEAALKRRHSFLNVQSIKDSEIAFFTHANRLLRIGADCKYCPICHKMKPDPTNAKRANVKSHIFPKCLLLVFNKIHHSKEKKRSEDFIYDFSRDYVIRAKAVAYPMLCGECEELCDERSLRKLYIFLMDKPDKKYFKVLNDGNWLQHVMANIMFRGILVSDSLPKDLQDKNFFQSFTALQNYCLNRESMPCLHLFLLRNRPINRELIAFLYPLEYVLRNPMFSIVIRCRHKKTQINFIYTKFDCFHLVLPLDDDSKIYFNRFRGGFDTCEEGDHKYVYLQWTEQCKSEKKADRDTKAVKFNYTEEVKPDLFPEILMNVCLEQYNRFSSMIYSLSDKSRLNSACKVMIEYLPGINYEHPTKGFEGDAVPTQDKPQISQEHIDESITFISKALYEKDLMDMEANASTMSPYGLHQRKLDDLREDIKKKNDELEQMKERERGFEMRLSLAVHEERKLLLQCHVHVDELTRHKLEYETQLAQYIQKYDKIQMLLSIERRELKRLEHVCDDNKKHIEHSEIVQKNLYAALEQMSAELRELPEDTKSCVYLRDKLLQKCNYMKEMISSNIDVHM